MGISGCDTPFTRLDTDTVGEIKSGISYLDYWVGSLLREVGNRYPILIKYPKTPFAIKNTDTLAEPPDTKGAKNSPLHLSGILKQVYGYFVWESIVRILIEYPMTLKI